MTTPETNEFEFLKKGEIDPLLGKKVEHLISQTDLFRVYLDEDLEIQYCGNIENKTEVNNAIYTAYALSNECAFIKDKKILISIRINIGNALSLAFDGHTESAQKCFSDIQETIRKRNVEISREWYFSTAYTLISILLLTLTLAWVWRDLIAPVVGKKAMHIGIAAIIGSCGAFLSIISRSTKINLDASAGRSIHITDSTSRIGIGFFAGAFIALLIKSGLLLGSIKVTGESKLAFLLSLALVAGFSERFMPNLIKKIEQMNPTQNNSSKNEL